MRRTEKPQKKEKMTSQQLLDVAAGVRRRELVDDVQRRLVICVPDVDVHACLQRKTSFKSGTLFPPWPLMVLQSMNLHWRPCPHVRGDFSFHKDSFCQFGFGFFAHYNRSC